MSGSTIPVFLPPKNPQSPISISVQPRLLTTSFGQGVPLFEPDGINVTLRQVTVVFSVLQSSDYAAIDNFLTTNIGKYVYFTLVDEAAPRLWIMTGRTRRQLATTWQYEISLDEAVPL